MSWTLVLFFWLLQAALGGFLILAAGALAVQCCRQPVRRLRLIELTLVSCLLVPWLGQLSWLPHWSAGLISPPSETVPASAGFVDSSYSQSATFPVFDNNDLQANSPATVPSTVPTPEPGTPAVYAAETPASATRVTPLLFVTLFICGVALVLAWWLAGLFQLVLLCRTTRPVPGLVADLFRALAGPAGDRVHVVMSDSIDLPLTFTGWQPVIVLPGRLCQEGDTVGLRYCLAHEWSHVQRGDAWRWYLATLGQLLFFYQPLFWWLRRQLRLCQDYLADARAAEQAPAAEDYADYLVRLARRRLGICPAAALGIGDRRSNLFRRILMLVHYREPLEQRCFTAWNCGATLGMLVLLVAVSAIRLDARGPEEDKKAAPAREAPQGKNAKAETLHYTGVVTDKDTGKPITGASVTVRRSLYGDPEVKEHTKIVQETKHKTDAAGKYQFIIPPEQSSKRYLYIELDVEAPGYAPQKNFGYALSMILKNEKLGGRPFFENVELRPAQEVSGVVQTPDGRPAPGVKVLAYSVTSNKKPDAFEYGSFADTRTDAQGIFRVMVTTPGTAVFWILPEKYVPSTHAVKAGKRGQLGVFGLRDGIRTRGKVLDARGNPVSSANVNVSAMAQSEELQGLPVADNIGRSAVTDASGEFTMGPLPPGDYQVKIEEHPRDSSLDRKNQKARAVPGVFIGQKVTLKDGAKPDPIEVRAVPHVTIEAQYYDSKRKTTRGHECFIFGRIDKLSWFGQGKADANGKITALIPHGLEQVQLDLMTNEHGVLRWRKTKDEPLHNTRRVNLGTVNDDVKGIEIIRYTAPILLVKVVAKDGAQLKDPAVTATYPPGKRQHEGQLIVASGRNSDVSFEHQEDGRFRSSQLFPDEEVTVVGHAEGYESKPLKVKLAEGETKELQVIVEKKN